MQPQPYADTQFSSDECRMHHANGVKIEGHLL